MLIIVQYVCIQKKSGVSTSLIWNYIYFLAGNIILEEFVEIFVQIYEGEDTGEEKTK